MEQPKSEKVISGQDQPIERQVQTRESRLVEKWEKDKATLLKGLRSDGTPSKDTGINRAVIASYLATAVDLIRERAQQKSPDHSMNQAGYVQRDFNDALIDLPSGNKVNIKNLSMAYPVKGIADGDSPKYREGMFTIIGKNSELSIVIKNGKESIFVDGDKIDTSDKDLYQEVVDTLMKAVKELPPLPSDADEKAKMRDNIREKLKKLRSEQ